MTISKSLKLTAMGLGLASIAITGCKKNDNNGSGAGGDPKLDNILKADREIKLEIGNGKIRYGGCARYKVTVKNANGTLIDVTNVATENGGGLNLNVQNTNAKRSFILNKNTNEICTVNANGILTNYVNGDSEYYQQAVVNDTVKLVAKYDGLTGEASAKVVADAEYDDLRVSHSLEDHKKNAIDTFDKARKELVKAEKAFAGAVETAKTAAQTTLNNAKAAYEAAYKNIEIYKVDALEAEPFYYAMKLVPGTKSPLFQIHYTAKVDVLDEKYTGKTTVGSLTSAEDVELVYNSNLVLKAKTEIINKEIYFYFDVPKNFGNLIGKNDTLLLLKITNKQGEALPNTKVINIKPVVEKLGELNKIGLIDSDTKKLQLATILKDQEKIHGELTVGYSHLDADINLSTSFPLENSNSNGYKVKVTPSDFETISATLLNTRLESPLTGFQDAYDTRISLEAKKKTTFFPVKVTYEVQHAKLGKQSLPIYYYVGEKPVLENAAFTRVKRDKDDQADTSTVTIGGLNSPAIGDITQHCAKLSDISYKLGNTSAKVSDLVETQDLDKTLSEKFNVEVVGTGKQYFTIVTPEDKTNERYVCANPNTPVNEIADLEISLIDDPSVKVNHKIKADKAVQSKKFIVSADGGKTALSAIDISGDTLTSAQLKGYYFNTDDNITENIVSVANYSIKNSADTAAHFEAVAKNLTDNYYQVKVNTLAKADTANAKIYGTIHIIPAKVGNPEKNVIEFADNKYRQNIPVTYTK